MYSKEASKKLRQDFWISFGKSFPRKWILYNTKIKGLVMKFHFDTEMAMVSMDVEHIDLESRSALGNNLLALIAIVKDMYLPEALFEDAYSSTNGKGISRIFIKKYHVSIYDKNTWQGTMVFLKDGMERLEAFFHAYKDVLKS
ncbi:MAG: DUF4268 domain-containing protein [Maribacter sp.]|nr:DUF4268 domain-containing protein [Maribacter sp.]